MKEIEKSTDDCYNQLNNRNGHFFNGLHYNFQKPVIYDNHPYQRALLGDLTISTRNHIGKYQGFFLLFKTEDGDYIRLKIESNDKKHQLKAELSNDETHKISYDSDAMKIRFDDFVYLLNENRFSLLP